MTEYKGVNVKITPVEDAGCLWAAIALGLVFIGAGTAIAAMF